MSGRPALRVAHPSFSGRIGVARRDITPPTGIYSRNWGCALHDVAEGIHRPLLATALACEPFNHGPPLILVSLDLGWWRSPADEWFIRSGVQDALTCSTSHLMIQTTHTHAGPVTSLDARDKPGGDKIEGYLHHLRQTVIEVAREAVQRTAPTVLSWTVGRCNLAANRDLPDPGGKGILCGYNPEQPADDTVLVGRITDESQAVIATIVNYACHPTTLGGANRLISPDYIGALREVVEHATAGAPCLFLQGASGELGPRSQYVADPAVADTNGRQLGYAALSALFGMLPHSQALAFAGTQASGAPLGIWHVQRDVAPKVCQARQSVVELELKREMLDADQLVERLEKCEDRVTRERLERAYQRRRGMSDTDQFAMPIWGWRLGDAILIGTPSEAYSLLQVELRREFPDRAVGVLNMVNGHDSYLAPTSCYGTGTYQVDVSLFGPGCLEKTLEACIELAHRLDTDDVNAGDAA